MPIAENGGKPGKAPVARDVSEGGGARAPAWEQIEAGRYRPRRIRGSFPGRELG